ncbi:DUF1753-domain-containing protein [Jaminaea rosea]|uniref:DUF1753-domain-containing protein n=1 Tax=Jaminaea rosea TaxID=1569628 RepID=A0A316UVD9_9BASI|nr:DUF1753-domain-containing protein [Jaminaea rosea]PWN28748.1 DUF1753-domain-containing protein [Jaminaea rosea]
MAITPSFHRYGPFTSFLRLVDLKLGCTILTLFNLFNKSAGVFGLLAIFQGGTWSQLSLYAYSLGTIFISLWGLRGISEESSPTVVLYAHCYLADHLISSIWSLYFFQVVYYYTEHNGQPPNLSPYQAGLMSLIEGIEAQYETKGDVQHHKALEGQARVEAAQQVWRSESAFSTTVLAAGWILKIYFALLLYSYALHLRHGTYRTLPLSKPSLATTEQNRTHYLPLRASISIERGDGPNSGAGGNAPRTIEEELPGWSDDEMDREDDEGEDDERQRRVEKRSAGSETTKATLDRLAPSSSR